jgi:hypothetical protein
MSYLLYRVCYLPIVTEHVGLFRHFDKMLYEEFQQQLLSRFVEGSNISVDVHNRPLLFLRLLGLRLKKTEYYWTAI